MAKPAISVVDLVNGSIALAKLASDALARMFTSQTKRDNVEALESGGVVAANKVPTAAIQDGAVTDAKITGPLSANARVKVRKNSGSDVGTRRRLNFIEGSNVTLTVADDATDEEVDITIAAASGSATHNLLSSTHPDTTTASPVAGDIITADSTPKWVRLAKGTAGYVLKAGASLVAWGQVAFSELTGTLQAGQHGTLSDGDHTGNLSGNARVKVRKNSGSDVGTRRRINFIEGSRISLTVSDDSADEEVDVTITAARAPEYTWASHTDWVTSSSGSYFGVVGYTPTASAESYRVSVVEAAMTVVSWRVSLSTAPGSGISRTFYLRKNQSNSGASITISGSNTQGTWSGSVTFVPGDLIGIYHTWSNQGVAETVIRSTIRIREDVAW